MLKTVKKSVSLFVERHSFLKEFVEYYSYVKIGNLPPIEIVLSFSYLFLSMFSWFIWKWVILDLIRALIGFVFSILYTIRLGRELPPQFRSLWREKLRPDIQNRGIFTTAALGAGTALLVKNGKYALGMCTACLTGYSAVNEFYCFQYGFYPGREITRYQTGIQDWEQTKKHLTEPWKYAKSDDAPFIQDFKEEIGRKDAELGLKDAEYKATLATKEGEISTLKKQIQEICQKK